jgi:cell pole-organizing protein PopZ
MSQAAKVQEPSMEEILASIRRIIADDDNAKPAAKAPDKPPVAPAPPPVKAAPAPAPRFASPPAPPPPAPEPSAMKQDDIDAMLAGLEDEKPGFQPADDETAGVLELTEAMEAPPAGKFRTIDGGQDVVFEESAAAPAPPVREPPRVAEPPRPVEPPRMAPPPPELQSPIISNATAAAVDSAFNALAQTVLVQNAKTLEDLVKEMLRPMLQHWLDNNLPTLVERLVRQEIERVARGR